TDKIRLDRYYQHDISVVVDRLVSRKGIRRRLTDSLETALNLAEGVAQVELLPKEGEPELLQFSQHLACEKCGLSFDELAPRNFSFNTPYGACDVCNGLGNRHEVDPELVVPDDRLSLSQGAISPWAGFQGRYFGRLLEAVGEQMGFSMDTPWSKLNKKQQKAVLFGLGKQKVTVRFKNRFGRERVHQAVYEGVVPFLTRRHEET